MIKEIDFKVRGGKRKNTGRKPLNLFSAQLYTSKTGAIAFFEES